MKSLVSDKLTKYIKIAASSIGLKLHGFSVGKNPEKFELDFIDRIEEEIVETKLIETQVLVASKGTISKPKRKHHRIHKAKRLTISALAALTVTVGIGAGPANDHLQEPYKGLKSVTISQVGKGTSLTRQEPQLTNIKPLILSSTESVSVGILDQDKKADLHIAARNRSGENRQLEFELLIPKGQSNASTQSDVLSGLTGQRAKASEIEELPKEASAEEIRQEKEVATDVNIQEENQEIKTYALKINDEISTKYQISSNRIKEDIILNSPGALANISSIDFNFNSEGLKLVSNDDGSYNLYDQTSGESLFYLPPPTLNDKNNQYYDDKISLTIDSSSNLASYKIDSDFLKLASENDLYPLTIDPTVTIATSLTTNPNSYSKDRTLFETTTGKLVNIYSDGLALNYRISTDSGNTWGAATAIVTSSTVDDNGFSGWIDNFNKIHLTYSNNNSNSYIFYKKLTFDTSNNTISQGSEYTVESAGTSQAFPTIAMSGGSNTIYVAYRYYDGANYTVRVKSSTDGITWSASTTLSTATNSSANTYPSLLLWNDNPAVIYNFANTSLRWNYFNGNAWQSAGWTNETITSEVDGDTGLEFSVIATADSYLHLAWRGSGTNGILYRKNTNGAANWDSSSSVITSAHNDRYPNLGLGLNNTLYLYYSQYIGAGSYNIKYVEKVGSGNFSSAILVTTDNANNLIPKTALKPPVTRVANYGLTFNAATNSYVTVNSSASLGQAVTSISLEAWVKTSVKGWRWIISRSNWLYGLGIDTNGYLGWTVSAGNNKTSTGYVSDGNLHHVAATNSSGTLNLYLDGKNVGTYTGVTVSTSTSPLYIGRNTSMTSEYWQGDIDEVAVYNRALSSAEVASRYNSGVIFKGAATAGLLAGWNMDANTGTSLADYSGNSNTGTIGGTVAWTATPSQSLSNLGILPYSPIIFVEGTNPYNIKYAPQVKKWAAAAAGNWSTAANWSPAGAPAAGDTVLFDGTSIQNCTVDSIADQIGNLYMNQGYSGTITFAKHPSLNADTFKINVVGEVSINSGIVVSQGDITVLHNGVTDGRGNEFASQNFTIGPGGNINADGQGFAAKAGPGMTDSSSPYNGGAYGGESFGNKNSTYGDYANPVSLGSGGFDSGGGGAITVNVAGTFRIDGLISANAAQAAQYSTGSGGSINILANEITGSGSINANGADVYSAGRNGGSGGRIALKSDVNAFSGTIIAKGGHKANYLYSVANGGPGTIFKKLTSQTYGDLKIDNGSMAPFRKIYGYAAHLKNVGDNGSYQFDNLTFSGYGTLSLDPSQILALNYGAITGDKNSGVINSGSVVIPDSWTLDYYFSLKGGSIADSISKNITISSNGLLTHYPNYDAENYKLNLTLANLNIEAGGEINTAGYGYSPKYGPGEASTTSAGAGHGGDGGGGSGGPSYGDYQNPNSLGSGSSDDTYPNGSGGGAITLNVSGLLHLDGLISSDAENTGLNGAASGGSVNITAGNIDGNGMISSNGGSPTSDSYAGGSGGRIKVEASAVSSSLAIQAYGGKANNVSAYAGSAGTIYKKINSQTYGDLVISNGTATPPPYKRIAGAHLKDPADSGSYRFDSISISNYGRLAIDVGQTLDYVNSNVTGDKNSGIINAGTVAVPDNWTLSHYFSSKNGTLSGWITKNLTISSNGFLTHYPNEDQEIFKLAWDLDSLAIDSGGEINISEMGYGSMFGPGKPSGNYAGASYGGDGGDASSHKTGSTYGDFSNPTNIGSGSYKAGGGSIVLNVGGNATINGSILANGGGGAYYGSGSGGSINIHAVNIIGNGNVISSGGSTASDSYAGGSGGRIKLEADSISSNLVLQAYGGKYNNTYLFSGSAGTIFKKLTNQTYGDLIISNGTVTPPARNQAGAHLKDPVDNGFYRFDSIACSNYGRLAIDPGQTLDWVNSNVVGDKNSGIVNAGTVNVPNNWNLSHYFSIKNGTFAGWTQKNLTLSPTGFMTHYPNVNQETYKINLALDSLTVDSGGEINVNEMGYGYMQGPGKPSGSYDNYNGAAYGGEGGNRPGGIGGSPYGDFSNPNNIGSGATSTGAGAIILNIGGSADIEGTLSANGAASGYGGGSGGSINVTAGNVIGNGTISSNGGSTSYSGAAGGSGGRIKVEASSISSDLILQSYGGKYNSATSSAAAASGTIYKKLSNQTYGDLIIDNAGILVSIPKYTPISLAASFNNVVLQNFGKLRIDLNANPAQNRFDINGNLTIGTNCELKLMSDIDGTPEIGSWPDIVVTGNVSVAGIMTASGTGFVHDIGYSSGKGLVAGGNGSGAGYGGQGGNSAGGAQGGQTYGDPIHNAYIGSGGGNTAGGAGGGMVKMRVNGNFDVTNTGTISSDGIAGGSSSGGGSGGSIQVVINGALTATMGSKITANGGDGGATGGGGGGGGRIALYPATDSLAGAAITVSGGVGNGSGGTGGTGSITIQHMPSVPVIIAPNNDGATNQSQRIAFRFHSTDVDNDWIQYKLEMATDAAFTQNVSTFDQTSSQNPSSGGRTAQFSNQDHMDVSANPVGYNSGTDAIMTVTTNLHQGDTFYYRVYAYDPEGVDSFDGTQHWSTQSATRSFTVAPIAKVAFTTAVQNIYVTNCSGQYGVQIQNSINESVTLTEQEGSADIRLSTTSGTGTFYSDGTCSTPITGNTINIAVGSSAGNFFYKDTTPSSIGVPWVITVSENPSRNWADGTQQVTVKPGQFGFLEITGYPAQIIAGQPFESPTNDIIVTVRDIYGNIKNDWTGQTWFYSSDSAATFTYNDQNKYSFTSGVGLDNGTHTFPAGGFVLKQAGNQSLVVHNTEGAEYDAIGNVNVLPASFDHFGMTSYPRSQGGLYAMSSMDWSSPVSAGPYNPRVTAYDAYNNIKTDFTGPIWFELYKNSDVPGSPESSTASYVFDNDYTNPFAFTGSENGAHTFAGTGFTVITSADDLRMRVKSDNANGNKYTDFTISIKPQSLDHFVVDSSPALSRNSVQGEKDVDVTLNENITVTAYDGYGNVKTDYGYDPSSKYGMIYFYSSDQGAVLPYKKTEATNSSPCYQFPSEDLGSHTFTPEDTPINYFTFKTGGYQTLSVSECIDPSSSYSTGDMKKYDPRLEPLNVEKNAASTGTLPSAFSDPNKIYIATHIPGSTHSATDHTNELNDLISASPGHQQAILSWHNPFDIPTDSNLEPQAYIYRCSVSCGDAGNFQKVSTTPAVVTVTPNSWSTYTDTSLTNAVTYRYKISYAYKKLDGSFIESNKSSTVETTPADIAPREVVAAQLDRTDSSRPGKIKVDYKLRWDSTVSLAYFDPDTNNWSNATPSAMSGDVGAVISGSEDLISHTAYFDPKIDFDGQYLPNSFKMRVKVTVNSGEASSDSELLTLDSKNPAQSTLVIDASNGTTANLTLNSSDDSLPLQMQLSTNQNFEGAQWESYATSKNNFSLDGKSIVYARFRDSFGNQTTISKALVDTPQNLTLKDGSNIESSKYRLLLIWDDIVPTPQGYQVYRSTDGNNFAMVETTVKNAFIDINLSPDTTYYYKVQAKDQNNNLSIPTSPVRSKPGTAPDVVAPPTVELFGWKQDQGVRAKISWHTDQNADSFVAYSTEPIGEGTSLSTVSGSSEKVKIVGQPDMTPDHEIMLYNLEPSQKYYYKVLSKNEIQATGYSPVYDFTTPERILLLISGVEMTDIKQDGALVSWKTSKLSTSIMEYGESSSYGEVLKDETLNTDHQFKLENLNDGTTYHIRIKATDTDQNVTTSDDYVFSTPAMPTITNLKVSDTGSNSATITWTTNVNCDSNVEFTSTKPVNTEIVEGRATSDQATATIQTGQQGKSDSTTIHSVTIIGLVDKTTYNVKAKSKDQFGNNVESDQISLTTTTDNTPPKIDNLKSEITSTGSGEAIRYQAVISWETNESSTSQVEYGQGVTGEYDQSTKEDLSLNQTHVVIINDLKSNSAYHFRVKTKDKSSNFSYSDDTSIITPPKVKSLIQLVFNTISDSFSWVSKLRGKIRR